MASPNAVFKSVMSGRWEHKVDTPQLLQVPQSLELFSIYDAPIDIIKLYVSVNGIVVILYSFLQWVDDRLICL